MLNRRHLRIKVLQALYAYFQSDEQNYVRVEKELMSAIDRIYDLYLYLLLSFKEIKEVAEIKIEEKKGKIRPSKEDLNPNLKFVNNQVLTLLSSSKNLRIVSEQTKVNWVGVENREMFKKMYAQITESEAYFAYMNDENNDFHSDLNYLITLFKTDVANSPFLYHFFEEKSIHWLDDIDLACSMVLKTIKTITPETLDLDILPLYKDPEDELPFIKTLLRKTIDNDSENDKLIDELTKNWELDRIAKMDVILMKMAITELTEFNNIPINVSLNEYIEISKFYSTPKSNGFINGVLDKAIERLIQEKKINKVGRGLIK
jgi:transcription antitermination protein NusB